MKKNLLMVGTLVSLTFLPGCQFIDKFSGNPSEEQPVPTVVAEQPSSPNSALLTGEVVASLNGEPIITSDSLEMEKDNLIKSKPELKAMLSFMDPDMLNKNLTEGLISQEVVNKYIVDNRVDKSAEYQQELADIVKNMRKILNVKFFSQQFSVSVSDSEVRKFYDENKNSIPDLMISQGGITAQGIEFASREDAQAFMTQLKAAGNNLALAAQQAGIADTVKDFNAVNAKSMGIDKMLKEKMIAIKTVPSVEMINSSTGSVWIISAISKQDAQYVPFEQVSPNIKQLLENNKRNEKIESEISALRKKYNVVVNEDFFKSAAPETGAEQADFEQADRVAVAESAASQRVA